MATGVTYHGAVSDKGRGIFADKAFWVARRVPQRTTILDAIKSNGGIVAILEKDADFMIADHARKDTLTGSLSWKFVTESVHNGAIQLEDRYRIGPDPDIPRPSGSGQPTKTTRTPFTHEEDVLLARFLLSHPDHQTGNNIYHDLGLKHPQHPWQSWRSRFVKKMKPHGLAYLQRLAGEEVGATGEPTDPPVTPRPKLPTQSNVACSSPTALDQTSAEPSSGKLPQITTPNRQNTQQQGHTPKPRIPAASRPLVAETSPSTATQEGTHQSARQTTPECALIQADAGLAAEQSRFYGDLKDYAEAVGLDVELENRIGDKIVDLYELSQAVLAQKVPIIEVDWMRVAEDLGYDWNKGQQVLRELQTYYDENLAEFVDGMVSFNEEKVIEEREQEPEPEPAQERIQDQVKQQGQEQEQGPGQEQNPEQERNQGHEKGRGRVQGRENGRSLEVNISSPTPTRSMGRKRPLDHVDQIDQRPATASPQNVGKRRRTGTNEGSPSTPDRQTRSTRRSRTLQPASPGVSHLTNAAQLQRVDASQRQDEAKESETQGGEVTFETQVRLPARLEIESQEGSLNVTPSQQLQTEALELSPIPIQLDKRPTDVDTIQAGRSPSLARYSRERSPQRTEKPARRTLPGSFASSAQAEVSGAANQVAAEENRMAIREVYEYYQSLGYPQRIVLQSMRCTTMVPNTAARVMQRLLDGEGLPTNWEGVWTDKDDARLRLVDAINSAQPSPDSKEARKARRNLDLLVQKHGQERIDLRRRYLDAVLAYNGIL